MKHKEKVTTTSDYNQIPETMREIYIVREARERKASDCDKPIIHGVFNDDGNSVYHGIRQACIDYCERLALPHKIK